MWLGWIAMAALAVGDDGAKAQTPDERLDRLEAENAEMKRRMEILSEAYEGTLLGDLIPRPGKRFSGLGPAASKVYQVEQGLSIGGYGEALSQDFDSTLDDGSSSGAADEFDLTRFILYVGYKFNEKWLLNTEIEIEHADEIFIEFAYLDYLHSQALNGRFGMLLMPMGFINELHEPTTFFSANRPETEQRIIPSTWGENGVGVHGDAGPFSYRAYVVSSLDGSGFDETGLRGGRQKGSRALSDDLAVVARLDLTDVPGLLAGFSIYEGNSGQDGTIAADPGAGVPGGAVPELGTSIYEVHAEYHAGPVRLRGLLAKADVDDAAAFNAVSGENLASEMEGWYLEAGYDLLADPEASLTPFIRYEEIDTQSSMPTGFTPVASRDREITTYGVAYQPHPQIIFKLDFRDQEDAAGTGQDQTNLSMGFIF